MKRKSMSAFLCLTLLAAMLVGCGGNAEETGGEEGEKTKIVMGTSAVSLALAESGVEALEEMGYEVEVMTFDDYFLPNQALVEGSLDVNLYQHEPFMDTYNEENGSDIVMLEPKLWNFWAGLYSVKADSIEELPDGGMVGIATDASNVSEDLKRLDGLGLITLTDEEKDLYDIADIMENPHNWEFINADHTKYTNMEDYTFVIGTSNTMAEQGVDPTENCLERFVDDSLAEGICILAENQDEQWAKGVMEAYTSDSAKEYVSADTGFEPVF